ncbi:hypothetical protein COB57_00095 [Candidatus Peregrinibacteria bacterium]|nr:MAG: hypothetical protein COB57_00095 [Candidatus Peregrinibacteria bacterium]
MTLSQKLSATPSMHSHLYTQNLSENIELQKIAPEILKIQLETKERTTKKEKLNIFLNSCQRLNIKGPLSTLSNDEAQNLKDSTGSLCFFDTNKQVWKKITKNILTKRINADWENIYPHLENPRLNFRWSDISEWHYKEKSYKNLRNTKYINSQLYSLPRKEFSNCMYREISPNLILLTNINNGIKEHSFLKQKRGQKKDNGYHNYHKAQDLNIENLEEFKQTQNIPQLNNEMLTLITKHYKYFIDHSNYFLNKHSLPEQLIFISKFQNLSEKNKIITCKLLFKERASFYNDFIQSNDPSEFLTQTITQKNQTDQQNALMKDKEPEETQKNISQYTVNKNTVSKMLKKNRNPEKQDEKKSLIYVLSHFKRLDLSSPREKIKENDRQQRENEKTGVLCFFNINKNAWEKITKKNLSDIWTDCRRSDRLEKHYNDPDVNIRRSDIYSYESIFKTPSNNEAYCNAAKISIPSKMNNPRYITLSPGNLLVTEEKNNTEHYYIFNLEKENQRKHTQKEKRTRRMNQDPAPYTFQISKYIQQNNNEREEAYKKRLASYNIKELIQSYRIFVDEAGILLNDHPLEAQCNFFTFFQSLSTETQKNTYKLLLHHKEPLFYALSTGNNTVNLSILKRLQSHTTSNKHIIEFFGRYIKDHPHKFKTDNAALETLNKITDFTKEISRIFNIGFENENSYQIMLEIFAMSEKHDEDIYDTCIIHRDFIIEQYKLNSGEIKSKNIAKQEKLLFSLYQHLQKNKVSKSHTDILIKTEKEEKELENIFEESSINLLTYFNNAQFGLTYKDLGRIARDFVTHGTYEDNIKSIHKKIEKYFNISVTTTQNQTNQTNKPSYDIIFSDSASNSFDNFADNYLKNANIAIGTDEFSPLISSMERKNGKKTIKLPVFDHTIDKNEAECLYKHSLKDFLTKNTAEPYEYIFISEVTRYGEKNRIDIIRKVLDAIPKEQRPYLILDGAQSLGRTKNNFSEFRPDIYIACAHKAGGSGQYKSAALFLGKDFTDKNKNKFSEQYGSGTVDIMKQMCFSLSLNRIQSDLRGKTQEKLSRVFIKLLQRINDNKIQIIRPRDPINNLTGIFEIQIKNIDKHTLADRLKKFGITVTPDLANNRDTIRVAFHNKMKNTSMYILTSALLEIANNEDL